MKITLRELFLLILVVALSLGWWLDRARLQSECLAEKSNAFLARELAGQFGHILHEDYNYKVSFNTGHSNGISVKPVNGHNGASFYRSHAIEGIEEVQAAVENGP